MLISVLLLLLTACGGQDFQSEDSEINDTTETVDVTSTEITGEPIPITITAGDVVLEGELFGNPTAQAFAEMLPLTVDLWHPADFARAFDLETAIPDDEPRTREYELGGLAYWYEGPSVAIFYNDEREETVVPVVTIGKITSDVSVFREYGGTITIERK